MTVAACSRIATISLGIAPSACVAFVIGIVLRFPPSQYTFYLRCPIYQTLHIECPGCGTTRALAAMLHGNFSAALHFNALTAVMLPLICAYVILCYIRLLRTEPFRWPQLPYVSIYAALAVAVIFTIARNLPLRAL